MDELQPGHPGDLAQALRNWLQQAESPIGSLPGGMDPIAWVVERFIAYWAGPARDAIRSIEDSLNEARALLRCRRRAGGDQGRDRVRHAGHP